MKKAWKMSSEATRKSTLSLLKRYLDSGNKPMKAGALAAKTAGVSPGTVYAWEKKAKTTTKTTNKQTIYFYTNWIQLILDNITEQTNN